MEKYMSNDEHKCVEGCGKDSHIASPNSIRDILNELYHDRPLFSSDDVNEMLDWQERVVDQAEQALNTYILGEMMAIIGDDLPTDMFGSWTHREDGTMILLSDEVIVANNLKAELRNKANKKWGK
jgi:hypothetical protein